MTDKEKELFEQEVSEEELEAVNGGYGLCGRTSENELFDKVSEKIKETAINIYEGGFPNCAATVDDGSWCGSSDACYGAEVKYIGMQDCQKAWR